MKKSKKEEKTKEENIKKNKGNNTDDLKVWARAPYSENFATYKPTGTEDYLNPSLGVNPDATMNLFSDDGKISEYGLLANEDSHLGLVDGIIDSTGALTGKYKLTGMENDLLSPLLAYKPKSTIENNFLGGVDNLNINEYSRGANYNPNDIFKGVGYDVDNFIDRNTIEIPDKGLTKKEAEELLQKRDGEIMEKANQTATANAKKAIEDYFLKLKKQQDLESKQILSKENKILLERAFKLKPKPNVKDWREWRCVGCGEFLMKFENVSQIEEWLQKFKVNDFKKCKSRRHANAFTIQDGEIKFIVISSKKIET